ncbi:MAG: tetratricopeptide repeat protein [Desulfobacterota bacterium]|nr:tetratricopeptide repeat protein [Thermodesulfobacteriota bacterium]MDW8001595.1 tetratricopeptide repeat protein [Deltaproteobacteria bacterium]
MKSLKIELKRFEDFGKPKEIFFFLVVLYSGILGGYLKPLFGITIFFVLCLALLFLFLKEMKLNSDSLIYLLFAMFCVLSTLWAPNKHSALLFSQSILAGSIFYIVLRSNERLLPKVLTLLIVCGLVHSVFGLIQHSREVPSGLFYNRNPYAGFLTPLVFLSLYPFLEKNRSICGFFSFFFIFSVFLSGSRGASTSILALFIILIVYLIVKKDWLSLKRASIVILCSLFVYIVFLQGKVVLWKSSLHEPTYIERGFTTDRFEKFRSYPEALFMSPLIGQGMNSFRVISLTIDCPPLNIWKDVHAHNLFFNILLELGAVGFLLFSAFLISVFRMGYQSDTILSILPLISFFLPNLFEYNFPAPPFQVLLLTLCASSIKRKASPFFLNVRIKKILCLGMVLFFLISSLFPVFGITLFNRAIKIAEKDMEAGFKLMLYADSLCWCCANIPLAIADMLYQAYDADRKKGEPLLPLIERYYKKALERDKGSVEYHIELAKFYFRTGRIQDAEAQLLYAQKLFPFSTDLKFEMGRFYREKGDYAKSIQFFSELLELYSKYDIFPELKIRVLEELNMTYKLKGDTDNLRNTKM